MNRCTGLWEFQQGRGGGAQPTGRAFALGRFVMRICLLDRWLEPSVFLFIMGDFLRKIQENHIDGRYSLIRKLGEGRCGVVYLRMLL